MDNEGDKQIKTPKLGEKVEFKPPDQAIKYPKSYSDQISIYPYRFPSTNKVQIKNSTVPSDPPNLNRSLSKSRNKSGLILDTSPSKRKLQNDSEKNSTKGLTGRSKPSSLMIMNALKALKPTPKIDQSINSKSQSSELQEILNHRGLIRPLASKIFFQCTVCHEVKDWPKHCFRPMIKEGEKLQCAGCDYNQKPLEHCSILMKPGKIENIAANLYNIALKHQRKRNFSTAREFYKNAINEALSQENDHFNRRIIARCNLQLGWCEHQLGNSRKAYPFIEEAREQFEDLSERPDLGWTYILKGKYLVDTGELETADKQFQQAISLFSEIDMVEPMAHAYQALGIVYRIKGNYLKSVELLTKSIEIFTEFDNITDLIFCILNLGITKREIGDYESAIDFLNIVIEFAEKIKEFHHKATAHSIIISIALKINDEELIYSHFNNLKLLALDHFEDDKIQYRYNQSEALILKASNRMTSKAKALTLFKEMLKENQYQSFEQRIFILLNIADLLLEELQAFEQEDVLDEIKDVLTKLSIISKDQDSTSIYFQSKLLEAKIKSIEGDFVGADKLLKTLDTYVKEKNLEIESRQIQRLRHRFKNELNKLDKITYKNRSLKERMEKSQIKLYIKQALMIMESEN